MRSPLRYATAILIAAAVGCSSRQAQTISASAPPSTAVDPAAARQADHNAAATAQPEKPIATVLAEKMAAYSRDMEPKLKDRQTRKPGPESQVKWAGEDKTTAAGATPAADPAAASAADVQNATPVASNQVAVLTPTPTRPKPSSDPVIVPEGEDVPGVMGVSEATQSSDQLLHQLATKVRENPKDMVAQLDYQLLQFVRGERVPHMASIAPMAAEDREVLTAMLDGISNFRSAARAENNQMLSRKVRPLVEMADRLRAQADLALPNAALCTRVDGFGVYEPITPTRFTGSKEHPFIIYCEVENFGSQLNDKKLWETRLSHEAVLYTETGLNVWNDKSSEIVDLSRNRRHDFFIVKKTRLPAGLPIGRYVLKLTVTDQQSSRVAETNVGVQIVAQ